MKKSRYLRIYDLHSWSGVLLGLYVYVVSFTGCLALFGHELQAWEDPAMRLEIAERPAPMMAKLKTWVSDHSQDKHVPSVSFFYPDHYAPYYKAIMITKGEGDENIRHEARWDTRRGDELLGIREGGLTEWIQDFHRDLMWPAKLGGQIVGRTLVGIAGIILMLSIVTGIVTHKKIIRELFTLRVKRSIHLKWQDLHKILGLWTLPFSIMISFTGAYLGVIAILQPLVAVIVFKGDTDALRAAITSFPSEPKGVQTQMLSVDELRELRHPNSSQLPYIVRYSHWGDEAATTDLVYYSTKGLTRTDRVSLSHETGEIVETVSSHNTSATSRASNILSSLHYGTYSGIWLKFLYLAIGIFLCVVTATGLLVWIERRLKSNKGERAPEFYLKLGRFSMGIIMGFPIASLAIFYLDKIYIGAESARLFYTGLSYFAAVFLSVGFAMYKENIYRSVKLLFILISFGLLGLPIVNSLVTESVILPGLAANQAWAWVDLSFIALGLILLVISLYLPRQRSIEAR